MEPQILFMQFRRAKMEDFNRRHEEYMERSARQHKEIMTLLRKIVVSRGCDVSDWPSSAGVEGTQSDNGCETKVVVKPTSAAMPPPKVSTSRVIGLGMDEDQFTQSGLNQFQLMQPQDTSDGPELQQLSEGPRKAVTTIMQEKEEVVQSEVRPRNKVETATTPTPLEDVRGHIGTNQKTQVAEKETSLFSGHDFSLDGFHQVSNVELQSEQHQQVILTSAWCLRSIHKDRHASGFPHPKMGFQLRVWDPGIT